MFFEVKNLNYAYLKEPLCLKDVNFSFEKNDKVVLLASEEQGKTTFVKVISSFDPKYFGQILLNGKDLKSINDEDKGFSVHLSEPVVLQNKSIKQNIQQLFKDMKTTCVSDECIVDSLSKFKITHEMSTKLKKLSLVQKIKFQMMRSYLRGTKIFFVDDIFFRLSDDDKREVFDIFYNYFLSDLEKTIVFALSSESYKFLKNELMKLNINKILYLNLAEVSEFKNLSEFERSLKTLDMVNFIDDYQTIEGTLFCEKGYYLMEMFNKVIRLDKKLNSKLEKSNMSFADSERIKIVSKTHINLENIKDDEINECMLKDKIYIFSMIDERRLI